MLLRNPALLFLRLVVVCACAALLAASAGAVAQRGVSSPNRFVTLGGSGTQWQTLTLTFATEVETDESLHAPGENPFLDFALVVTFVHPASGTSRVVNGFYAADGDAADTSATAGNRWQALFTPDRAGLWKWSVAFRHGPGIALDSVLQGEAADPLVDGASGVFRVAPADPQAPGFLGKGRLDAVGGHYWRFAESGEPFLQNGAGGPENFLAYFEFDGTVGNSTNVCLQPPQNPGSLHRYAAHAADYLGDAVDLQHRWGPEPRGENILGAIDYLASVGVNSLYFITNTYQGDGEDVWPWVTPADKLHFDVSKLAQWERVFAHMNQRGILLQFVFEENENDQLSVAAGGLGYGLTPERRLYYREMVARFAHHQGVNWVIGDESNYYDEYATMESMASAVRALDPYSHPLAFHGKHPCGGSCSIPSVFLQYSPYFEFPAFEASVFQTAPGGYNNSTVALVAGQASSARKWAHYGDEQSLNATPTNLDENRSKALWGNLMGGGAGVAWYPGNNIVSQYPPGVDMCDYFDLSVEDLRFHEDYFRQTGFATGIFRTQLPFTEMVADNDLASPRGSQDYVFHRPENQDLGIPAVYAVYRAFGTETELTLGLGTHSVDWFNPRTGEGPLPATPLVGPGPQALVPLAQDPGMDWLAIVRQQ